MDNLIRDDAILELAAWAQPGAGLPGWDITIGGPLGAALSVPGGDEPLPGSRLACVQNYFAEYRLEYFRQRRFNHFPSRPHALLLFATRTDAMTFRSKHPRRLLGKSLASTRSAGAHTCSFDDASRLDYLRLPHSLGLAALDEVAEHYWPGRTVEEVAQSCIEETRREAPVIEGLFQDRPEPRADAPPSGWLPGFA